MSLREKWILSGYAEADAREEPSSDELFRRFKKAEERGHQNIMSSVLDMAREEMRRDGVVIWGIFWRAPPDWRIAWHEERDAVSPPAAGELLDRAGLYLTTETIPDEERAAHLDHILRQDVLGPNAEWRGAPLADWCMYGGAHGKKIQTLRVLLDAGAVPPDVLMSRAVGRAANGESHAELELLLEYNAPGKDAALRRAVEDRDFRAACLLCAKGADPDARPLPQGPGDLPRTARERAKDYKDFTRLFSGERPAPLSAPGRERLDAFNETLALRRGLAPAQVAALEREVAAARAPDAPDAG